MIAVTSEEYSNNRNTVTVFEALNLRLHYKTVTFFYKRCPMLDTNSVCNSSKFKVKLLKYNL